ncbi:uncharacterized protein ACRADG_001803 [Cochliomyia hominivorax]
MLKLTKFLVFLTVFCVAVKAAPYQELPPRPGFVPVYIREGNTPLSEVNPKLVEAFHEDEESNNIQKEIETPKELQNDNDTEQNVKGNEEKSKDKSEVVNEEQTKSPEQEQDLMSDIAEFTSDDLKKFDEDDKHDNETKLTNE